MPGVPPHPQDSLGRTLRGPVEGELLGVRRRGGVRRWMHENEDTVDALVVGAGVYAVLMELALRVLLVQLLPGAGTATDRLGTTGPVQGHTAAALLLFLGLVALLPLLHRRDRPVTAAAAATLVTTVAVVATGVPTGFLPLAVLVYSLALYAAGRDSAPALVVVALGAFLQLVVFLRGPGRQALIGPDEGEVFTQYLVGGLVLLSCLAVVYGAGLMVRRDHQFEQQMIARAQENENLAVVKERNRIAREMHDVVAHSLTVMISLSDGARIVARRDPERSGQVLQELSRTGRQALADMRRTLGVLRDEDDHGVPLGPLESTVSDGVRNLRELAAGFVPAGLPVRFVHRGTDLPEDANLRLALYRVVQEALTNALRYGRGVTEVEVVLAVRAPEIRLRIDHDGDGQPAGRSMGSGQGLHGIHERVGMYGGDVTAGPNHRGGWCVDVRLTWEAED